MGVKLSGIVSSEQISLDDLKGRIIAIDAFNMLYQFLATIRSADGTPLKTSSGMVSSHLVGLFSRTTNLMERGIKPIFVFDGQAPELKRAERERRSMLKAKAREEYESAKQDEDVERMKKYAARLSKLTPDMIEQSKRLLGLLGVPQVTAASEGEAYAAQLVRDGIAYASASEDYDSLLFGSPRLVRQLSVSGKKRKSGKLGIYTVQPELISLPSVLSDLSLSHEQLVVLGILVGTDFNIGGVHGIGPKKALKLLERYGHDFASLFGELEVDMPWEEIMGIFLHPAQIERQDIVFGEPDREGLRTMLVDGFEFSAGRIDRFFDAYDRIDRSQKSLSGWL